jgi:hypothetical protein
MEQQDTTTYTPLDTERRLDVPTFFLELLTFEFKPINAPDAEYKKLRYVSPQRLSEYYQRELGWYTVRSDIEFNAIADQDYLLKLHYLVRWNLAAQNSNWLLTFYPDAYFYGTLLACRIYFKDTSLFEVYQSYFDEAFADLNELDSRGRDDSELEIDPVVLINTSRQTSFPR